MINIMRENTKVLMRIETDLPYNYDDTSGATYPFSWNCHNPAEAELLARYLNERLHDTIERIRREEYEEGWRDKTAKRRKKVYFASEL